MLDSIDLFFTENPDAIRVGWELVHGGKARIVRFDLMRHTRAKVEPGRVREPIAVYYVTIERTDNVMEEPRSFVVQVKHAARWLPYVDAMTLHRAPSGAFEWPRARYGSGDDGLRMLAPDNAEFACFGGGELEEPDEPSTIRVSCMPIDRDLVSLSQGGALSAADAIKLGRVLVWMGQRVEMRKRWRATGPMPGPDFIREMDRQNSGLSPTDVVRDMLDSIEIKAAFVSQIHATYPARVDHFEVLIEFTGGQGCPVIVDRTGARSFVAINRAPLVGFGTIPTDPRAAPGHYAAARGTVAGPAATPQLAREWLDARLRSTDAIDEHTRYAFTTQEIK